MFGYIVVNKPELKFKEFDVYQSYYCGLCQELRRRYGLRGQLTLTYDLTFLLLLLTGLYEPKGKKGTCRCPVHPRGKNLVRVNEISGYAADMNLLMAYYKCQDDWADERDFKKAAFGALLKKGRLEAEERYPMKAALFREKLSALSAGERDGSKSLDEMAGYFGEIMGELFAYRKDEWEGHLRAMGFYLGKFIYLMDAYEDLEKDRKEGNYNPLEALSSHPDFEDTCRGLLNMMMAECCGKFELLPIIKHAEILRNILYAGVWCRFERVSKRRREEQEKKDAGSL